MILHDCVRRLRTASAAAAVSVSAAALVIPAGAAVAQGVDCSRLQAQISSLRGDPGQVQRFQVALERAARELDRTVAYARQLGCENHQFLFFGSAPPPQCEQLNPQIARMQANVQQLQQRIAYSSGEAQRRSLSAQYNAYCGGGGGGVQAALQRPRSFFEQLFGGGDAAPSPPPASIPINPGAAAPPPQDADQGVHAGAKAVCVRMCDGGFFPVSYTATRSQFGQLQTLCNTQCPNAQTELFTYPSSGVIDQAVSTDGKPYSSLPNANVFRTRYDPACTCKPPHQSWAQALAGAENVGDRKSDIIVTQEKADQLSRPSAASTAKALKAQKASAAAAAATASGAPADDQTAVDIANSAQGPTVGEESADIGSGAAIKGKAYGERDGHVVEEAGPDGAKRRVRIIGP